MRSLAQYVGCVAIVALAGCGDDTPPDDVPVPTPGGPVTFLHQGVAATEFAFPATIPDGHGSALFVVRNDTDATVAAIAMAMDGDPGFAIDDTMSTCVAGPELVPLDLCTVMVRWSAAADASAELVVTSGDVVSSLQIRGTVGGAGDLLADASHIDVGVVPVGTSVSVDVRLTNTGANPFGFVPGTASGYEVFRFGGSDCPFGNAFSQVVPAGGSCNVTVDFTATTPGWVEGIGIPIRPTGGGLPAVTFDAYAAHRIQVVKRGAGTGRIISVPTAIDCGTDCGSQIATVIGDATLYEQPDDSSLFAGWQLACGTGPSCTIFERAEGALFDPGTVVVGVTFAGPESAALAFTIDGSASGKLFIGSRVTTPNGSYYDQVTECTQSCTTYVPVGTQLELYAATPSTFGGWAGDCTGGDVRCELEAVGDTAATATFDKDDRELATLLPDVPAVQRSAFWPGSYQELLTVDEVAFAPDGDLVIVAGNVLMKLGLDGTVRWTRDASEVGDLAVTTDGEIHQAGGTLLASPNGDLALFGEGVVDGQGTNLLTVLQPDGSLRFRVDLGPSRAIAVAVGPDGGFQALVGDQLDVTFATSFSVVRYDASGSLLPGSGPYTMTGAAPSVAIDSAGALAFHMITTDKFPVTTRIGRILLDGTVAFETTSPDHDFAPTGVAYDAAGNVVTTHGPPGEIGIQLEQRSPTGSLLWAFDKSSELPWQFTFVLDVRDVAFSNTGQVAVGGSYGPVTDGPVPWIEVFQMP